MIERARGRDSRWTAGDRDARRGWGQQHVAVRRTALPVYQARTQVVGNGGGLPLSVVGVRPCKTVVIQMPAGAYRLPRAVAGGIGPIAHDPTTQGGRAAPLPQSGATTAGHLSRHARSTRCVGIFIKRGRGLSMPRVRRQDLDSVGLQIGFVKRPQPGSYSLHDDADAFHALSCGASNAAYLAKVSAKSGNQNARCR